MSDSTAVKAATVCRPYPAVRRRNVCSLCLIKFFVVAGSTPGRVVIKLDNAWLETLVDALLTSPWEAHAPELARRTHCNCFEVSVSDEVSRGACISGLYQRRRLAAMNDRWWWSPIYDANQRCDFYRAMHYSAKRVRIAIAWHLIVRLSLCDAVFENTYFTFLSDFKKNDFLHFFEMTFQKRNSRKKYQVCWMPAEILASKLRDVMGTYRHLSHTVLSCIVSCVHTFEQHVLCWWQGASRGHLITQNW